VYAPLATPAVRATGERVGHVACHAAGHVSRQLAVGETFIKYFALGRGNPNYDWHSFDFDKDPARLDDLAKPA
jgi:hypothetical protein